MSSALSALSARFPLLKCFQLVAQLFSLHKQQFAELIRRRWTHHDISLLAGGNLLRVLEGAEKVADKMKGEMPSMAVYDKRRDLDPKDLPY